jgi:hypothetical protein
MARKIRKVEGYVLGELGEKGKAWGLKFQWFIHPTFELF